MSDLRDFTGKNKVFSGTDSELISNGIAVKVHIQNFKDGFWSETFTSKDLETKIEDNILNEAISLRKKLKK